MKISKLKDLIQGLGEVISDCEITTFVLNVLTPEWSSFVTNIYSRKYISTFEELWAQCVLEETILKVKDDTKPSNEQSQYCATKSRKKFGIYGRFEPR